MSNNCPKSCEITMTIKVPSLAHRLYSVWFRHVRVYTKNFFSNALPAFLEPLIFLMALGLGLGQYIVEMDGIPYIIFLASGIMIPASMFTAAYECSFGTFIRLEYDKAYDGMLAAPITPNDLIVGEIIFAGTKSLFFSFCVLTVLGIFNLVSFPMALLAPLGGLLTGLMFASLSILVTSFVKTINHFSFYFTGLLTPMFFFSGIVFPLTSLPANIRWVAEIFPLTHPVRIVRAFCLNRFYIELFYDLLYIVLFILIFGFVAVKRLKKRLVY